jgi:hypothetical protein
MVLLFVGRELVQQGANLHLIACYKAPRLFAEPVYVSQI